MTQFHTKDIQSFNKTVHLHTIFFQKCLITKPCFFVGGKIMEIWMMILFIIIIFIVMILLSAIKIMAEYERIVVFRLGRLIGIKGPGLVLVIPILDRVIKLDLRTRVIDVPKQRIITRDNVTVDVDAVVYFRITDPQKAVVEVQRYDMATSLLSWYRSLGNKSFCSKHQRRFITRGDATSNCKTS